MPAGKSVLVVDDSRELPVLIERAFRRIRPGTVVFPLPSGERAVEHLLQCGDKFPLPDLVLLDRHMPGGMDGFETLSAVRGVERLLAVSILMISGSDDEDHIARAKVVGADGYLRKPVTTEEISAFARQIIQWRIEESWRSSGGTASGLVLAAGDSLIPSAVMNAATPVIDIPSTQDENSFLRVFNAVREFVHKSFDQVDLAISEACRKHNIPVSHARGRGQDQVTVANRHAVIFTLWDGGLSDKVILENFQLSQRAIERLRAEWRARKAGGLLTDRQS